MSEPAPGEPPVRLLFVCLGNMGVHHSEQTGISALAGIASWEEAARLGFCRAVVPQSAPEGPVALELLRAGTLLEAIRLLFGPVPSPDRGTRAMLAAVPS